jgi:hypothetical protein
MSGMLRSMAFLAKNCKVVSISVGGAASAVASGLKLAWLWASDSA